MNVEKLKEDLTNAILGAVHNGYPEALIDLKNIEKTVDIYVLRLMAREYGFDPDDYLIED